MPSLTRAEAMERAATVRNVSYRIDLDLDRGAEVFGSRTELSFEAEPGSSTWCDLRARSVESIILNGEPVDAEHLVGDRLSLAELSGTNTLEVVATMAYSHDGQGLHRATDPADGLDYVYGHLFLDAAPTVYACFDQPDIKAPYDVTVTAPADWVVVGNGAATRQAGDNAADGAQNFSAGTQRLRAGGGATQSETLRSRANDADGAQNFSAGTQRLRSGGGAAHWTLATTRPLATYFVTVCAGPYVSVRDEHDGIELGIFARASLREPLERHAPELLEVTTRSFDYFHELFGIRYPFGEYNQVFVPEFNAGAMENPGCVTLRDQYLFRGAATRDELLGRANTVSHEMSHMWFGDLVTMQWWDDLWLNESFAEYMSHRCLVDATDYREAWVDSGIVRKVWGYGAERSPSTHPVAGVEALDAQSALQNFDGISYAKGAAALRQLIAYVGDDAFIHGVRAYLEAHAFGNGTFADFLGAIETSSGTDLQDWARAWLLTADRDTVSARVEPATQGALRAAPALQVHRTVPAAHPADRPHALQVAAWRDGQQLFRVPLTITDDLAVLDLPEADLSGAVLVPNATDETWALVQLDPTTLANLPEQLAQVPDDTARTVIWSALVDGVHRATVSPEHFLDVFVAAWEHEPVASIRTRVAAYTEQVIAGRFVPRTQRPAARSLLAEAGLRSLRTSEPGSTFALAAARLVAGTTDDREVLDPWLRGDSLPAGLEGDGDFRWIVARNLAAAGVIDAEGIDLLRQSDDTLQGRLNALMCRAALPASEHKQWAWDEMTQDRGRSNYEMVHLAQGFWQSPTDALVETYVERYFTDLPAMTAWVGEDALSRVVLAAFPKVFTERTAQLSAGALARQDLSPAVRRSMVDGDAALREVLASLSAFGSGPSAPSTD